MQERVNTVSDFGNVREAVCVSTQKIMDACRDQDCMEDVAVYLTQDSQETLETATSVKARSAELLYADVCVEPVGYQDGYYSVNISYFYKVIADAILCAVRPAAIYGLATATKRVTLFGGEEGAKRFASDGTTGPSELPLAVVEAIDPVILQAKIVDRCHCHREENRCCCLTAGLPEVVAAAFDGELVIGGVDRQLTVTLGQFSLVRLERQTQLLIPSYDYCMPEKSCCDQGCGVQQNPCEAFSQMSFPVRAFFPQAEETSGTTSVAGCSCGNSESRCCSCGTAAAVAQEAAVETQAAETEEETRTIPVAGNRTRR
jgi:hypothetical protein